MQALGMLKNAHMRSLNEHTCFHMIERNFFSRKNKTEVDYFYAAFYSKRINPIHCHFGTETHFKYSIHIIRELVLQDTTSIGHVEVQKVRLISPKDYAGNSLKGFRMKRTLN
ncbi:hypothetical protein ACJX0J_014695 [Zea mays]